MIHSSTTWEHWPVPLFDFAHFVFVQSEIFILIPKLCQHCWTARHEKLQLNIVQLKSTAHRRRASGMFSLCVPILMQREQCMESRTGFVTSRWFRVNTNTKVKSSGSNSGEVESLSRKFETFYLRSLPTTVKINWFVKLWRVYCQMYCEVCNFYDLRGHRH